MANLLHAPRGTLDVTPDQTYKWRHVEQTARSVAARFGFEEIRFPTFEYTELFARGVGDTTDVVQKEMYTFEDRGGRSITLRPEGTASTVRALLQNGMAGGPLPLKLFYLISCFRGERPQAGRLREFHQFGAELFGAAGAAADVELIELAGSILKTLGVTGLRLELNSIGCPECRKQYHAALRDYFKARESELCEDCKGRLERNPMRILDCKVPACKEIAKDAPLVLDYLCEDCKAHFEEVKARLDDAGQAFVINPRTVRGLDYYTRTVFEFVDEAQGLTVCGGGRYDGLVSQLGGPSLPGLGFGMGLERLLILMEAQGCTFPSAPRGLVYIAPLGAQASLKAAALTRTLREAGIAVETDLVARSVKAQMKYADKQGFAYSVVIGDAELEKDEATLKSMRGDGAQVVPLTPDAFRTAVCAATAQTKQEEG
ncbi:histidine--tRNA ligase [Ethanoligenens sp.]|uniref:histidine--tRNA ligase n=1 Tax=Ethanoligenens sp. TaxID=2099655 RepID=UPI0039EAA5FB